MSGFQQAVKFCLVPSRGHLAMFGDIFGCHILIAQLRQNATGIQWVEARDAAKQCKIHRTAAQQIIQFNSVAQSCPTPWSPINCSTPGLPVHHQLLESTQTHVHRVGDAIQLSQPLSSPSPPAPNPSQH